MSMATSTGPSERVAVYKLPDNDLATGSTFGGATASCIIKANGALQKVYSTDFGQSVFGAFILRFFDRLTGMHLYPVPGGLFILHPEHQEHLYSLPNGISIREDVFVLTGEPASDGSVDPPAVYYTLALKNNTDDELKIDVYAFVDLRGDTDPDVMARYDESLGALVAWNESKPAQVRIVGSSLPPTSYDVSTDVGKAVAADCPGNLSNTIDLGRDPLGALHHTLTIAPGQETPYYYLLSFGAGVDTARANYQTCPQAAQALQRTMNYFTKVMDRSVVFCPNDQINHGVLWAKANMLRIQAKSPTGWCFTNDPTRSNNSVARDTSWYTFGSDFITPEFSRESLLTYVRLQEPSGMIPEYYDIRSGKTFDYGVNINDNTPLIILALWHHYSTSGDRAFLQEIYDRTVKAAEYILSQRNDQGLVWCTADGQSNWGIVGWRNIIQGYRLSGATTEVNSECYAALKCVSRMARALGRHADSSRFGDAAAALRAAINTHLYNPTNGLYYLNIDIDGKPRSDVTADLVFPVMFGVSDDKTSAHIIRRLSDPAFWTAAGIRTVPRDAPDYDPDGLSNGPYGLRGGVWVAASFWFAFAAANHSPEFMNHALSSSFRNYSMDPRKNNTVPGQFSEWLHGETLVNEGMMLSPWDPPRYLWAAIEGMAGLKILDEEIVLEPRLSPEWKWLGVRNLPYHGKTLSWLAVKLPNLKLFTNFHAECDWDIDEYAEDITDQMQAAGDSIVTFALQLEGKITAFAGTTAGQTVTTSLRFNQPIEGSYRVRLFDSLLGEWSDHGVVSAEKLKKGYVVQIERRGFCLLDLHQET